jgi:hypothetical protein
VFDIVYLVYLLTSSPDGAIIHKCNVLRADAELGFTCGRGLGALVRASSNFECSSTKNVRFESL